MFRRGATLAFSATPIAHGLKVCVGVKQVVDYTVKVRVKDNKVQTANVKMSVNPFDEIAIEQAVRMKEKKLVDEIYAITIGKKSAEPVLRSALALGCTKAIHLTVADDEAEVLEPLAVAKAFAKLHEEIKPDIWLLGKQAIDGDFGMTPQLLAGLLDIPQGTFASVIELNGDVVKCTREIDAGRQVVEFKTPCVLAADLRLNTPRNAALPKIMAARKVKLDVRELSSLGVDTKPRLSYTSISDPPTRKAGIKVKSVEELVDKLKNEAKVI